MSWDQQQDGCSSGQQTQFFIEGPGRPMVEVRNSLIDTASQPSVISSTTHQFNHHDDPGRSRSPTPSGPSSSSYSSGLLLPLSIGRAIVAPDNDVSNGFVKDGKMLPYVFEANDSGVRKRSSKILPVCGVCGKRFVCVTTMKRHLVTHTGEKPFSCKVCGKQYTQKGNLRVHERTHRNDRPFECNICHQKFYRKEPMQKHQWRQHGIVHSKTRPLPNNAPTPMSSIPAAEEHYNPEVVVNQDREEEAQDFSRRPELPSEPVDENFENFPQPPAAHSADRESTTPLVRFQYSKLTQKYDPLYSNSNESSNLDMRPPLAHTNNTIRHSDGLEDGHAVNLSAINKSSDVPKFSLDNAPVAVSDRRDDGEFNIAKPSTITSGSLLHAERETEANSSTLSSTPIQVPQESGEQHDTENPIPMKLKLKLAQAYQREVQELRFKEQEREEEASGREYAAGGPSNNEPEIPEAMESNVDGQDSEYPHEQFDMGKEMVECQCKSCGTTFSVMDPYNFRCSNCNVKYTSVPTHLIADPLQCIGCCKVFPHKPALKAHQTRSEKERPFRCCKCGYGFRQKAHLQKHQWRIHRRKLEADQSMKDAEAIFQAMKESQEEAKHDDDKSGQAGMTTVTIQDIINHRVEHSLRSDQLLYPGKNTTSSKYFSSVLGLDFDGPSAEKYKKIRDTLASREVIVMTNDSDDSNDEVQRKTPENTNNHLPLDLSPVKEHRSRRSDSPSVDKKLRNLMVSMPFGDPEVDRDDIDKPGTSQDEPISFARALSPSRIQQRENNPLLCAPPLSSPNASSSVPIPAPRTTAPLWKKPRVTKEDSEMEITSHKLPPIAGLQKPPSTISWKRPEECQDIPDRYRPTPKLDSLSRSLFTSSAPPEEESARGPGPEYMKNQLLGLQSHDARTV